MKTNKMQIFILFLVIHTTFSELIEIKQFEEITYPIGSSNYSYDFSEFTNPEINEVIFYFNFTNRENLQLKIINENNQIKTIKINSRDIEWIDYKVPNLSQKYIFEIINNAESPGKMKFIDSSKEINTYLDIFINLNFSTGYISDNYLPLIFNIDIKEDILFNYIDPKRSYMETLYVDGYLLSYCAINENECQFKGFKGLYLEKGKKYKIKYDFLTNSYHTLFQFKIIECKLYFLQEMDSCSMAYKTNGTSQEHYFIYKSKIGGNLGFYAQKSKNYVYYGYLYLENSKDFVIEDLRSCSAGELKSINVNENCYAILKITDIENEVYKNYLAFINYQKTINKNGDKLSFRLKKGECGLVNSEDYFYSDIKEYILVSSNRNMGKLDKSISISDNYKSIFFYYEKSYLKVIIDSTKEESFIKGFISKYNEKKNYLNQLKYNIILDDDLSKQTFSRANAYAFDFGFDIRFYFDIKEKYYFYVKKHYGKNQVYQYKENLNSLTNISQFKNPYHCYENSNLYKAINNELIILSGFQLFTFIKDYNSLYDIYIQKVDDSEIINLNRKIFEFNNLVKLVNPNKYYYLNFSVDHLIKLDNKFLGAEVTFTDENGENYYLNNETRVLKNLKGNNIRLISDKNALLYFYTKISNYSGEGIVIFDKSQKGKNIKFNLRKTDSESHNIYLVKDICFEGYYPLISRESWTILKGSLNTIYAENILDYLEYNLYEDKGEKYIIYIFDSLDNNNFYTITHNEIYNINYIDNVLNPTSKYNIDLVPGNSNGYMIFNMISKPYFNRHILICDNKSIKYYSRRLNYYYSYDDESPFKRTLEEDSITKANVDVNQDIHVESFESTKDFFHCYSFNNGKEYNTYKKYDASIISVDKISKNIIRIKFTGDNEYLRKYYVIAAKKDDSNNIESFSNKCYLLKLMTQNSNSIIIKTIFENTKYPVIITDIEISRLNIYNNEELILTIISQSFRQDSNSFRELEFGTPNIFRINIQKEAIETLPEKYYYFDSEKKNFFKIEYNHERETDQMIIFHLSMKSNYLFIFSEYNQTDIIINENAEEISFPLKKSGIFYIEFYPINGNFENENFVYYFTGKLIGIIDLTEKYYYRKSSVFFNTALNPEIYKINNLKNDVNVFFAYKALNETNFNYNNPFKICDNQKCEDNIIIYKFIKGNNYTIYINSIGFSNFYYPSYYFFPIMDDSIEEKGEDFYYISEPKIYYVNLEFNETYTAFLDNGENMYFSLSNQDISINNLYNLDFKANDLIQTTDESFKSKFAIIIPMPYFNEYPTKLIITRNYISKSKSGEYFFLSQTNGIIYANKVNYTNKEDISPLLNYNNITTIISPIKNMKLIIKEDPKEKEEIICFNDKIYPVYVDKYKDDINIIIKKYAARYAFFDIFFEKSFDESIYRLSYFNGFGELENLRKIKFLNIKIDTNLNTFNEYFNFYILDLNEKINIYIKKYYGNTEIYEDDINLIDLKDFSILAKPMKIFEGKRSLFDKIFSFENNKIITGYFSDNSLFNLYVEIEDESQIINYLPSCSYYSDLDTKHAAKYLKSDVEYQLNFTVDHLIKLEPGFNAEVEVYNSNNRIILNSKKPTGVFKGNNVKIKANNNAMVYLYDKNRYFNQIEIDKKQKGKNVEILLKYSDQRINIDFGFEGYNPSCYYDYFSNFLKNQVFLTNIYDNLEAKLVEGEKLYVYTNYVNTYTKIIYTDNLHNKNNKYNFDVIPKNPINKTLIIGRGQKNKIRFQINYCKPPHLVEMYYQDEYDSEEDLLEFNNETMVIEKSINIYTYHSQRGSIKIRFQSEDDFVFSYSFIDETDNIIDKYNYWNEQRIIETNLNIEIAKKNPNDNSNIFSIKFKPNYRNSATKYIIVIVSENEDNTIENLSNPCYISKLVTERVEGTKILDIVDTGEDDLINVDIDIYDILNLTDNYIVNIISQEIRYEKKINYYIPTRFSHNGKKPIEIDFNKQQEFIINNEQIFNLPYTKLSNISEVILLHFKLEKESLMTINIKGPNGFEKLFDINQKEETIDFLIDEGGIYEISFKPNEINNDNNIVRGIFDIVSTEYPIELNIKENIIHFKEINIEGNQMNSFIFNINSLEQDYIKKIEIANFNFSNIKNIASIKKNNEEFKTLNFTYFTFKRNTNYQLKINFNKKDDNHYVFEQFYLKDYSLNNIKNFTLGECIFNDINDKFLIINWKNYDNIIINVTKNNAKFFLSKININQIENFIYEFQNFDFKELEKLNMEKRKNILYEVLMIELNENDTQIIFEEKKKDKKDKTLTLVLIIGIIVLSLILIIVIFFIVRHIKRKNANIDFNKDSDSEPEKLMPNI